MCALPGYMNMAQVSKNPKSIMQRALMSLLASAAVAVCFVVLLEFRSNHCWIWETGAARACFLAGLVGTLVFSFLMLGWRGRTLFILLLSAAYLGKPHIDRVGISARQASAVGIVGHMNDLLQAYRKAHPHEGYPAVMPRVVSNYDIEKYYRFEYAPVRAKPDGPAEDYVLRARPIRRSCGYTLNVTSSGDGHVYSTFEDRPATRKDELR